MAFHVRTGNVEAIAQQRIRLGVFDADRRLQRVFLDHVTIKSEINDVPGSVVTKEMGPCRGLPGPCPFNVMQDSAFGHLKALGATRRTRLLAGVGAGICGRVTAIAHCSGFS